VAVAAQGLPAILAQAAQAVEAQVMALLVPQTQAVAAGLA
jgi:hypothetical protein